MARSPDELSLSKGDRIELIERDDDFGDGWFLGKHMTNGNTGLFPEVYTRPAPKGMATLPVTSPDKRAVSEDFSAKQQVPSTPDHRSSAPVSMSPSAVTSHNPVMNETLDVIKEHINDMKAPLQNLAHRPSQDAASNFAPARESYIRGHETDEEEGHIHTEEEVMTWTPARVAEYLEDNGVEKQHCDVFREQEISGEVLLNMEQSSVFIKEFELGSVGRRLKTWQKVKALQDEARTSSVAKAPRSVSDYSAAGNESLHQRNASGAADFDRKRSSTITGPVSQYLTPSIRGHQYSQSKGSISSFMAAPGSPQIGSPTGPRFDGFARPSAQSIRSMNHARRHSSLGSEASFQKIMSPTTSTDPSRPAHARGGSSTGLDSIQAKRASTFGHKYSASNSSHVSQAPQDWGLGPVASPNANENERGYFSGNELEKRNNRRSVLQKRSVSATHSRNPSETNITPVQTNTKMDSPQASATSSPGIFSKMKGLRASSASKVNSPSSNRTVTSPVVTRLDYDSARSPTFSSDASSAGHSPHQGALTSFFTKPRITGLRTTSDSAALQQDSGAGAFKPSPLNSPSRTGSTTPSFETKSIDQQKSENSARLSTGSSQGIAPSNTTPILPAPRSRAKAKSKKTTSAYTRGLEKKAPVEQIAGADYSGWMKKKSTSLVGSWKPRLFVLRGRRLSYYYSENDTEEKGLIDISGHRVLPASNDRVAGLHASLTGAKSPQPPEAIGFGNVQTSAATDMAQLPTPANDEGLFMFKLVPPRQGLSKAVNFTKPTVHYFAVNSRQEGRLWMAALMKATIDYDSSGKVTTSYNQPTISLAKARARRERPPALRELVAAAAAPGDEEESQSSSPGKGLGIDGLDHSGSAVPITSADPTTDARNALSGADENDGGAPSELPDANTQGSVTGGDESGLDSVLGSLKKKEALQMVS